MEKEYYDAQVKYINEIRSIRHDMQAHLIVLQYYLESENYEKARSYLGDMKQHQMKEHLVVKDTGNDLVNAIVSDTLSYSSSPIDFEMQGLLPENLCLSEYDMCTVFSNLLSNAKEACEKLVHIRPFICMNVEERKEDCLISIQNPIEWKIQMKDTQFVTFKKDKERHGIGTKNIIKVVKQYNGSIDFIVTEEMFRVEIVLPKKI